MNKLVLLNTLYIAFATAASTTVNRLKSFRKTLLSYSHVMLCRDRSDGSLRGMMLVGIEHCGSHTLIKVNIFIRLNKSTFSFAPVGHGYVCEHLSWWSMDALGFDLHITERYTPNAR